MALLDTAKLCIHTMTTRPWPIEQTIDQFSSRGVRGLTVWRQALKGRQPAAVGNQIRAAGLSVVSLCRGGFFPAPDQLARQAAIDDNLKAIDEAAELGAPLIVLVCGALPQQPLEASRRQIHDGIASILPHAEACGVKLGIEPLHPMYADSRSAINTMKQANDMCDQIGSPYVGIIVDVYHLWWDPELEAEIKRCGQHNRLFAFHVCDWKSPTEDMLNDRGLMGEGCIPIPTIRRWVEESGFDGFNEVEIFSDNYWAGDQSLYLDKIIDAYRKYV